MAITPEQARKPIGRLDIAREEIPEMLREMAKVLALSFLQQASEEFQKLLDENAALKASQASKIVDPAEAE